MNSSCSPALELARATTSLSWLLPCRWQPPFLDNGPSPAPSVFLSSFASSLEPRFVWCTRFSKFLVMTTVESFASSAMGLTVGCFAPSPEAALALGPSLMTVFIVFGGYYVNADNTPLVFRWIPNASLIRWYALGCPYTHPLVCPGLSLHSSAGMPWAVPTLIRWYALGCPYTHPLVCPGLSLHSSAGMPWAVPTLIRWYALGCPYTPSAGMPWAVPTLIRWYALGCPYTHPLVCPGLSLHSSAGMPWAVPTLIRWYALGCPYTHPLVCPGLSLHSSAGMPWAVPTLIRWYALGLSLHFITPTA